MKNKTSQLDWEERLTVAITTFAGDGMTIGEFKSFFTQEIQRAKQEVLDDFREKFVQIAIENDKIEAPLKGLVLYTKTLGLITKIKEEMK